MSLDDLQNTNNLAQVRANGRDALAVAKAHFETALASNATWRLLKALETGTGKSSGGSGEAEQLRSALASEPLFITWQLVEAALAYFDLETQSAVVPIASPAESGKTQDRTAGSEPVASTRLATALSTRIPTLTAADSNTRTEEERATAAVDADTESTRFSTTAAGIEEAQVKIVVRPAQRPLIDTNLPPLPLTEKSLGRPHASRSSAAPARDASEAGVAITSPKP